MKIYTGRGDKGETDLRSGGRVSKSSPRIEAYGAIDEVNAFTGEVVSNLRDKEKYRDIRGDLLDIQNRLFIAQADLADKDKSGSSKRIDDSDVSWLEGKIDEYQEELDPLEDFIIPGGSSPGSKLHIARTVSRRAERRAVELAEKEEIGEILRFLNRLSDLLFQIARVVNKREGVREENPTY